MADRMLGLLPFYHIYGIMIIMLQGLKICSTIVTLPKFHQNSFISALQEHKFTTIPLVPPLLKYINECDDVTREHLQSCHTVTCGAAPLSKSTAEEFNRKCGSFVHVCEGYGMTETLITHTTPKEGSKLGYCGKLLPHVQAKIADIDTGAALPPHEKGEIWMKTPCVNGWLHTGDVAVYDEDGYFSIVDRIKELIKVKGFQVSPSELEDVLLKHPAIADAGVIGIPHENHGEVPRAYIVKSKKASVTEKEINEYMKGLLAPYKQLLGGIKFVTDLPKNPTGKLLRRVLAETAAKEA
ncbi:hypothetical protein HAZT_HAZT001618 [Hyalella azteca]|uniref:Uncharacterized protein n=1 Tax=Hyalella azteca TaxID=294128 RepID=A0A6A0GSH5_HYAAZ|nr:hypothetical protein HAZT_HAZT001618 [Hyalella azteca]